MKRNQLGSAADFYLAILAVWAIGLVGWIANIVKIVSMLSGPVTAMFVGRVVGVFAFPLGAVLGFF